MTHPSYYEDGAVQAYETFEPLDSGFCENVTIQMVSFFYDYVDIPDEQGRVPLDDRAE